MAGLDDAIDRLFDEDQARVDDLDGDVSTLAALVRRLDDAVQEVAARSEARSVEARMAIRHDEALAALGERMQGFLQAIGMHAAQTAERSESEVRSLADALRASVTDAISELRADRDRDREHAEALAQQVRSLEAAIRQPRRKTIVRDEHGDAVGMTDVPWE